ncbi:MAG: 4'-phosphopantetheinyl transferase superfamily protein [Prevotella sp.]|jgi:4'-phosphopantetheinyl transferase EntD|nr:4'-phosphopantetheinyl transferase family protein [Prevotella sp.]MCH4251845.1 4'-phosphopantetheinyl transferase superfamily protein [Prevotella sp.]
MALLGIQFCNPDTQIGLWKIQETIADFYHIYPCLRPFRKRLSARYHSEHRQLEFLAVHALVHEMSPEAGMNIRHSLTGQPLLAGWNISISHTVGYAVVALSKKYPVGVDIEYFSDRVTRVASRFLRSDEMALDLTHLLIHWCAKEAVYKYDSEANLGYKEMRLEPFLIQDRFCIVDNLKSQWKIKVFLEVNSDYVLTLVSGAPRKDADPDIQVDHIGIQF